MLTNLLTNRLTSFFVLLVVIAASIYGAYAFGKARGQAESDEGCRLRVEALAGLHVAELAKLQADALAELERREFELFAEQQAEADRLRKRAERAERQLRDLRERYDADVDANPVGAGCGLPASRLSLVNEARRCWTGGGPSGCDTVRTVVLRPVPWASGGALGPS